MKTEQFWRSTRRSTVKSRSEGRRRWRGRWPTSVATERETFIRLGRRQEKEALWLKQSRTR